MPISRIKTDGIQDDAITSAKIGVDVIVADDLAANSVGVSEITNGAVTSAKLDTNIDIAGTFSIADDLFIGSTTSVGNANADDLEITNSSGSGTVGMTFNVNSGSADTGNIYWRSTTSNNNIQIVGDPVTNYLAFATSAAEKLRIDSSGNIGIGTSSPVNISGYTNLTTNGTSGSFISLQTGGTENLRLFSGGSNEASIQYHSGGFLTFVDGTSGGTERLRIDSSGRLGIGTNSPSYKLHSTTSSGSDFAGYFYNSASSGNGTSLVARGGANNATPNFQVQDYNGNADFTVLGDGKVGIGTTGAQTLLHLYGGSNTTSVLTIDATGTGGGRKWSFRPGDPITPSNGYFTLRDETAGENRVVITDGGNFRVGHSLATTTITTTGSGNLFRTYGSTNGSGFHFTSNAIYPSNYQGSFVDNQIQWGSGSYRWQVIFAASGTINTSDVNEKQDVENLSDAERTVATAIKGLIKKFRFIDAVEERGDDARIHVGVIAQEVEQAFIDAGLDPRRYGMFCEDIWYEVDGEANPDEPYTEDTPGAIRKVRLGIRYDELLAFVISAL